MRITNSMPSTREWQRLGNTRLDLNTVVKIEFERPDARLFVLSGEALLMTAWTESRAEVTTLKQLASEKSGWVIVATEPQEVEADDYPNEDPIGSVDDIDISASGNDPSHAAVESEGGEASPLRSYTSDHRVRLSLVDRIVTISTSAGKAMELFASGVFLGQVSDSAGMEQVEIFLDQ